MELTPSPLSQARKQDEKLCERLEQGVLISSAKQPPFMLIWPDGREEWCDAPPIETRQQCPSCAEAAARIRALNQALMEASHDRDRFMADAERRRAEA